MSSTDKLFVSRVSLSVVAIVAGLIVYSIFTTYSNEIENEVIQVMADSFGHLKGELANL